MIKILPVLFAEICITILGGVALAYGLDGAIFATTIAAIAGLGGYSIRSTKPPSP
jgi:ethanolamine transporter EutH